MSLNEINAIIHFIRIYNILLSYDDFLKSMIFFQKNCIKMKKL